MKRFFYSAALAASFFVIIQSCSGDRKAKNYNRDFNQTTHVDNMGLDFIKGALEGGLTEIKASQLAKTHSQNPRILSFADMMISDHSKAGAKLKNIKTYVLVSGKDTINDKHKSMINMLAKKTGSEFDKAYVEMMVKDHEEAVKLFSEASGNLNRNIEVFAKETLPIIQMHLDSAKAINSSLK